MWRRPTTHKNNMPKTTNGLWAKLIDFDNLYQAFQEARHGKRYRLEVMRFASNLEENLINLQNHLIWKTWAPGKQREFTVFEPKMRMIQAPPFPDRVIHHALVRLVDPLFERNSSRIRSPAAKARAPSAPSSGRSTSCGLPSATGATRFMS